MIVVMHARGTFGIPKDILANVPMSQAVSFFFVLSGFILTYVHPTLNSWEERLRFLLARIARVWPAQVFSVVCIILLLPSQLRGNGVGLALLAVSMLQSWIPIPWAFSAFNDPAWSISTEFFFYLCFPFLIWQWRKTWLIKSTVIFAVAVSVLFLANYLEIPLQSKTGDQITLVGLIYVDPIVRIVEFVFGMCLALLYDRTHSKIRPGRTLATVWELTAFGLVATSLLYLTSLTSVLMPLNFFGTGNAGLLIFENANCAPAFGILIFVISLQRGLVSQCLKWPVAVFLGEISYSIYLFHEVLMRVIHYRWPVAFNSDSPRAALGFAIALLVVAYLSWYFVERPARSFLVGLWPARRIGSKPVPARIEKATNPQAARNARAALAAVIVIVVVVQLSVPSIPSVPIEIAHAPLSGALSFEALQGTWTTPTGHATISRASNGTLALSRDLEVVVSGEIYGDVLRVPDWHSTARLTRDGGVLFWSNGSIWRRSERGVSSKPSGS